MAATVRVQDVIALFRKAYAEKWGYIWGASGQIHTQAAQDQATRAQTKKYGQQWVGKRVADCSGLFTWAYKQLGSKKLHPFVGIKLGYWDIKSPCTCYSARAFSCGELGI